MRLLLLFFLCLSLQLAFAARTKKGKWVIEEDGSSEDTDTLLREISEMSLGVDTDVPEHQSTEETEEIAEETEEEKIPVKKKKREILGKVIVTANFESSLKKFKKTLKKVHLVNDKMEWIAEKTILVIAVSIPMNIHPKRVICSETEPILKKYLIPFNHGNPLLSRNDLKYYV
jgi:hypothetical protein